MPSWSAAEGAPADLGVGVGEFSGKLKQTLFDGAPTRLPPPIWQTTTRARVFGLPGGVGA